MKKNIVLFAAAAAVIVGGGVYFVLNMPRGNEEAVQNQETQTPPVENQNINPTEGNTPATNNPPAENNPANGTEPSAQESNNPTVIGKSVNGTDIDAYHYGTGEKEILFVGGVHGGYAWNTTLLAYQLMDYLKETPSAIPNNVKITVIPVLNPDGLGKAVSIAGRFSAADVSTSQTVLASGRFNANKVDLNRNFDCGWKAAGVWQNKPVSGGTAAFSEPESAAIRDYAQNHKLAAVVAWYSAGGGVYSSSCNGTILPETQTVTDFYAKESGYKGFKNFESYQVSGDMTDWFAKNNIPAISVLLTTHSDTEWKKNEPAIGALVHFYAK